MRRPHETDVAAERGVVGCWLHGSRCDDLDPAWITCDRRRALLLAADLLREDGQWHVPRSRHPAHELEAACGNAERVAHAVRSIWHGDDDPRAELELCLDAATVPGIVDYYVRRLRDVAWCRQEITAIERRLRELTEGSC
jgi:hypothetical protein